MQLRNKQLELGWFQIRKGVHHEIYAKYIMRNAGLEEAQAGIKIARRNINNLSYADDTTLWQKVKDSRAS